MDQNNNLLRQIDNYDVLLKLLGEFGNSPNYVFRGQVQNYETKEYSFSFVTSFDRKGCIPYLKFKWDYYCLIALKSIVGPEQYSSLSEEEKIYYSEAFLQHYGWRSMQLDMTTNIMVAMFFAGFKYSSVRELQIVEDCNEIGVVEVVDIASYLENDQEYGYVFIFDRKQLEENKRAKFIDLSVFDFDDIRSTRQKACIIGSSPFPINEIVGPALIQALKIKKDLLTRICKEKDMTQQFLFPTDKDPIYSFLISLPRKEILSDGSKSDGFFFIKELNIPDYSGEMSKIKEGSVAFYSRFWVFDDPRAKITFRMSQTFVYYKCYYDMFPILSMDENCVMKEFIDMIKEKKEIVIEFDSIYKHMPPEENVYQKAIRFSLDQDSICVSEIYVKYAGKTRFEVGQNMSRYFKINGNKAIGIRRDGDCPCNNHEAHLHNLWVGQYFALMAKHGDIIFEQDGFNSFWVRHK